MKAGEDVLHQAERRVNLSSCFVIFGPQQIGCYPPTVGRAICFAQFTDSRADLFPNTLRDTPGNNASPASGHLLVQASSHAKFTMTPGHCTRGLVQTVTWRLPALVYAIRGDYAEFLLNKMQF